MEYHRLSITRSKAPCPEDGWDVELIAYALVLVRINHDFLYLACLPMISLMTGRCTLNRAVVSFVQRQIEELATHNREDRGGAAVWTLRYLSGYFALLLCHIMQSKPVVTPQASPRCACIP
jgi:hypothetical protein